MGSSRAEPRRWGSSWPIEALLGAMIALSAVFGLVALPSLPDPAPVHFGRDGSPDAWERRGPGLVLRLPAAGLAIDVGLGLVGAVLALGTGRAREPGSSTAAALRVERLRLSLKLLTWVRAALVLLCANLEVLVVHAARSSRLHRTDVWLFAAVPVLLMAGGAVDFLIRFVALRHGFSSLARARPGGPGAG